MGTGFRPCLCGSPPPLCQSLPFLPPSVIFLGLGVAIAVSVRPIERAVERMGQKRDVLVVKGSGGC